MGWTLSLVMKRKNEMKNKATTNSRDGKAVKPL